MPQIKSGNPRRHPRPRFPLFVSEHYYILKFPTPVFTGDSNYSEKWNTDKQRHSAICQICVKP